MTEPALLTCRHTTHDLAVAAVTGDLDHETAPALRAQALALIAQGHRHLILDLSAVTFCDSSGLNALIGIMRCARLDDGSLTLADAPERLRHLLRLTGLERVLPVHPTAHDALAARS